MSLCITVLTNEGIAVAGDSRQTQMIANVNRIGSDNANKVFELTDHVLAATAGWAFLQPEGATLMKNIASLIEDFKPTLPADSTVHTVAMMLWNHFNTLYQQHIVHFPAAALPAGQVAVSFAVTGYDPASRVGMLFSVEIPSATGPTATAPNRTTANMPGPWWIGQTDVAARIIKGYDGRILALPFVQAVQPAGAAVTQLDTLNYAFGWNTMTLQDAIDFAVGMIQITTTIQRFTPGMITQPGAANVGGPIDVAVVRPGGVVSWVCRKDLHL
jgi:hypothetical protein